MPAGVPELQSPKGRTVRDRMVEGLLQGLSDHGGDLPSEPRPWLQEMFPSWVDGGFAPHHEELWNWIGAIEAGERLRSFVGIFSRRHGKSTAAELATVYLAAKKARSYFGYVCATQNQANQHVRSIGSLLESSIVEKHYPALAQREITKFGHARAWRMDRLRTASGITIDAIGLNTAIRGVKMDDVRPDMLILDDLDDHEDSRDMVKKKIRALRNAILPIGSSDLVVLFIQNLIHRYSIASRLAGVAPEDAGDVEILQDRYVSGPVPAVRNLSYEQTEDGYEITGGDVTWNGFDLEDCQAEVDRIGLTGFLRECQHEVTAPPGGMFDHIEYRQIAPPEVPEIVEKAVWCDPAVSNTEESDCNAIVAGGLGVDDHIYQFFAWERRAGPTETIRKAILKAMEIGAMTVGIETDQGGHAWEDLYYRVLDDIEEELREEHDGALKMNGEEVFLPEFDEEKAGSSGKSKEHRIQRMLQDYEGGNILHVTGTHRVLERGLDRFPGTKPFDVADAAYWTWHDLREETAGEVSAEMPL